MSEQMKTKSGERKKECGDLIAIVSYFTIC